MNNFKRVAENQNKWSLIILLFEKFIENIKQGLIIL